MLCIPSEVPGASNQLFTAEHRLGVLKAPAIGQDLHVHDSIHLLPMTDAEGGTVFVVPRQKPAYKGIQVLYHAVIDS